MSLLFNLLAKLSVKEGDIARFSSNQRETPYMLVDHSIEEVESSNDEESFITNYWVFNPRSEKLIKITGKKFPNVLADGCQLLGTSRGWTVFMSADDYTIHLTEVFNPWSSESSHKTIALPPLTDHLVLHAQMVANVSLSTSFPNQDDDYMVSVFFRPKLCYCMPNRDSEWTVIDIPFSYDNDSHVVYSRKDQMFYLLTSGCAYMAAFDLKKNKNKPNFLKLQFENFPLITQYEWEILASCFRGDYIAESSSGERFIVHWYVELSGAWSVDRIYEKTKRFMVFRIEDEERYQGRRIIAKYTENIGDLCIFIGNNETFCLEASKFLGLRPNSIYYSGYGFGVYDISNRSSREYSLSGFPTLRGRALFLSPSLY